MKMNLITAVLMTMAFVVWIASALLVPAAGDTSITRWFVVVVFAVLAVIYWVVYFRKKKASLQSQQSGTE